MQLFRENISVNTNCHAEERSDEASQYHKVVVTEILYCAQDDSRGY